MSLDVVLSHSWYRNLAWQNCSKSSEGSNEKEKRYYLDEEAHLMPRKKVAQEVPKIAPLPGYLRVQYIRCGRANCHCRNTNGHGPYYYRVVTVRGKKWKQYVKKDEL